MVNLCVNCDSYCLSFHWESPIPNIFSSSCWYQKPHLYITNAYLCFAPMMQHVNFCLVFVCFPVIQCLRCGVQFLGNAAAGFDESKSLVWGSVFSTIRWVKNRTEIHHHGSHRPWKVLEFECCLEKCLIFQCALKMGNFPWKVLENDFMVLKNIGTRKSNLLVCYFAHVNWEK